MSVESVKCIQLCYLSNFRGCRMLEIIPKPSLVRVCRHWYHLRCRKVISFRTIKRWIDVGDSSNFILFIEIIPWRLWLCTECRTNNIVWHNFRHMCNFWQRIQSFPINRIGSIRERYSSCDCQEYSDCGSVDIIFLSIFSPWKFWQNIPSNLQTRNFAFNSWHIICGFFRHVLVAIKINPFTDFEFGWYFIEVGMCWLQFFNYEITNIISAAFLNIFHIDIILHISEKFTFITNALFTSGYYFQIFD